MTMPGCEPRLPPARDLGRAFGRLGDELADYRRRVLPRLADPGGPDYLALGRAADEMADNAGRLARELAGLRPVPADEEEGPGWTYDGVRAAVAAARDALEPAARDNLLSGRLDRRGELPAGWAWDGTRMIWSLTAMLSPWPAAELDRRARLIADRLGVEAAEADGLRRALADLPPRRLVRAFRRLARDEFYALAEALVRTDPAVPDAVLLIPTGRSGPAAAGGLAPDAAGMTGPLSWLLGAALEVRANNHFGLVWRTAVRPECRGNRRCFQAAQVLDYSGPRKLDHRLSYTGGPGKGERWQAGGRTTRRPSRPKSPWPRSRGTRPSTSWPAATASTRP